MGLPVDTIELMIRLRKGAFLKTPGAVIEIGAQQLSNEFLRARDRMEFLGQLFGVTATTTFICTAYWIITTISNFLVVTRL
jgi:hypothetical protein